MKRPILKKAALVTGGAKRIGRHLALHLAGMGYDIALHYRRSRRDAEKTAREIRKKGVRCELFCADLSQPTSVSALIPDVLKTFPHLQVLVNNASVFSASNLRDASLESFRDHFKPNFLAPYQLTKDFLRFCSGGDIINIIDTHYTRIMISHADYILSKKLLADLTELSAREGGPHFRVNGIAPGLILAPAGKMEAYLDRRAKQIPLQRKGSPQQLAHALQFLLENEFVTGQIIFVDGGEHLL